MRKAIRISLLSSLIFAALPVWAEGTSAVASIPPGQLHYGPNYREQMRELPSDQREQLREERRQRREIFEQLSPEQRYQLRRDIRSTADVLAPRRMVRLIWG